MEIDYFLDIGMEIGLLFDILIHLLEEGFVDELLDTTHSEMRNEVLPVAKIAEIIECVKDIFL